MKERKAAHRRIKELADQGQVDLAFAECEKMLLGDSGDRDACLRLRAYLHSVKRDYASAMADREAIVAAGEPLLRDFYQLGDTALKLDRYSDACMWLEKAIQQSEVEKDYWFVGAAYFLMAYGQMRLGHFSKALESLERAVQRDPECAMPLPRVGMWDHNRLRAEIARLQ